jgi:hypothetical protein
MRTEEVMASVSQKVIQNLTDAASHLVAEGALWEHSDLRAKLRLSRAATVELV